jgi:uncharacterized membrane protein
MRTYIIALYVAALCASPAAESLYYSVVPLGPPAPESDEFGYYALPSHINNRGDIVGMTRQAPFIYHDGTLRHLWSEDEPFYGSYLSGINDRGVIVGAGWPATIDGALTTFTYPTSGRDDLTFSRVVKVPLTPFFPWDINDKGTIVGDFWTPEDWTSAMVYSDGKFSTLPALVPGANASAFAVNNRGEIIGTAATAVSLYNFVPTRAVIWSPEGQIHDLGLLPGSSSAHGEHINDHGEAIGHCHDASVNNGYHPSFMAGFIYRNGLMSRIPVPPDIHWCRPRRINDRGDVLIQYYPRFQPEAEGYGAWLYADGVLLDLDQMVSEATGWRTFHLDLSDINDSGAIVGVASYDDGHAWFNQGILLVPSR